MTTDALRTGSPADDRASPLAELAAELEAERAGLERELAEMELLLQQARSEAERHEQRRAQAYERLELLEADPAAGRPTLAESRQAVSQQTRRATLMASQVQLLESKQKSIRRFEERLRATVERLNAIAPEVDEQAARPASARAVMAAQEQMRREIARQMHDGPAQSIANIALQAEVVQRLLRRDPARAEAGLAELGGMVQNALEATKTFIFDVRPMVLDDLGIVATLRRSARERADRAGIPIRFESVGADRRLDAELESALFRMVDDALSGFVAGKPAELLVRLSWSESTLEASVRSRTDDSDADQTAPAPPPPAERDSALPPALAEMIDDQRARAIAGAAARRQARGLPPGTWAQIQQRATSVGIEVRLEEDARLLVATTPVPR